MPKIVLLPGDGIGPEVLEEAKKVLLAVGEQFNIDFHFEYGLIGGTAYEITGNPLPLETIALCQTADAVLLGAVGGPNWDNLPGHLRPEAGLLGIRQGLGLYANLRPARVFPSLTSSSPLKPELIGGVDLLVVRELTGDAYFGQPKCRETTSDGKVRALDTMVYTEEEVERIAQLAFQIARQRRSKVTSVDKANVLESSRLWREVVRRIHQDYTDVELVEMYVDNCAMQLVRYPAQFDVLLTSNLFGDILSDQAAMLTGSLGMLPSASLGGDVGLYEPVHGSAPDIAGQGCANPLAAILSAAMLLRYSLNLEEAAQVVETAVEDCLLAGYRTRDIATKDGVLVGTAKMGSLVASKVGANGHV